MKNKILTLLAALALCSYGYAQDEDEYEDEDTTEAVAPAPAVDDEDEAPVQKKAEKKKKAKKSSDGSGFLGIAVGLDENSFSGSFEYLMASFKLNESMMLSAKFGLYHHGETSVTTTVAGVETETDGDDDMTPVMIGAQFDYFLPTPLLPTSIGGEFNYISYGEEEDGNDGKRSQSMITFGFIFGAHANLTDNLVLTGQLGLGFAYMMTEESAGNNKVETGRPDFGTQAGIKFTWFFM